MKLQWAHIKNFRSITDSGRVYFNSGVTVFAGKNESGKTNILRALSAFSLNKFDEDDEPQDLADGFKPEITVSFQVSADDLNHLLDDRLPNGEYELVIKRRKGYLQVYSGDAYDSLTEQYYSEFDTVATDFELKLVRIATDHNIDIGNFDKYHNELNYKKTYIKYARECLDIIFNFKEGLTGEDIYVLDEDVRLLSDWLVSLKDFDEKITSVQTRLSEALPNFVLFDSFDDILPDLISMEDQEPPTIVKRFFSVVDVEMDQIFSEQNGQRRKRVADKTSAKITGNFGNFYQQETIKITINPDGNNLYFFIYDKDESTPFRPQQRSKGMQWFLSFFLTLQAEATDNSIILIDEPGLYLHPKAQEDVLRVLETISEDNQVLLTTHSPYLIDPNRLERVRLVARDQDNRTFVENKVHKGADKDTMTPVITAIGLDVTKSLVFSPKFNVLVEGISDYYYFEAFKRCFVEQIPHVEEIQFVPNVGAQQIPNMAALLFGWEIDFVVVLDNDKEGKSVQTRLIKDLHLDKDRIIFICDESNKSVEDLFDEKDFIEHVLPEGWKGKEGKNSTKVKDNKALLAKQFNSNVEEILPHLCDVSVENFKRVLREIVIRANLDEQIATI